MGKWFEGFNVNAANHYETTIAFGTLVAGKRHEST